MGRIFASLAGATAVVVLLLFGAANASASLSDVPTPTVTGPIANTADSTPWSATDKPLGDYGYVEDEYKYSGDAFQYDTSGAIDQTGTKLTTGGPADDGKYPFKTRMIVRRPADPADFNGTVVVEWLNVTAGFDLEANWFGDPEYLLKHGYAYVGITAQRVGVNWLRGWDAGRYGDLDVSARDNGTETITNDALSYDIYGSGIKALLDGGTGVDPLGNLPKPETVIASGESQSGSRLSTYYNKVQPIHDVVDAFLITVSTGAPARRRHDAGDPGAERDREPDSEDRARHRRLPAVGGRRRFSPAEDGVRELPEADRARHRIDALGELCEVPALARPVAVRGQLGVRAPCRLGQRRRGAPDRTARRLPGRARRPGQPARARRQRQSRRAQSGLPEVSVPVRLNTGINSADPARWRHLLGLLHPARLVGGLVQRGPEEHL